MKEITSNDKWNRTFDINSHYIFTINKPANKDLSYKYF